MREPKPTFSPPSWRELGPARPSVLSLPRPQARSASSANLPFAADRPTHLRVETSPRRRSSLPFSPIGPCLFLSLSQSLMDGPRLSEPASTSVRRSRTTPSPPRSAPRARPSPVRTPSRLLHIAADQAAPAPLAWTLSSTPVRSPRAAAIDVHAELLYTARLSPLPSLPYKMVDSAPHRHSTAARPLPLSSLLLQHHQSPPSPP